MPSVVRFTSPRRAEVVQEERAPLGPDEVRLRMRGDLDSRADGALGTAYDTVAATGTDAVTLDFADVGYINSWSITM